MDKELRMLGEKLDKVHVNVVPNKQVAEEIDRKGDKLLGSYRRNKDGKYVIHNIFLPESPTALYEESVLKYMEERTGLDRIGVAFGLLSYGKLHELGHIGEDDELENERDTLKYLKGKSENDPDGKFDYSCTFKEAYTIAKIANACDYINEGEVAKDLAKEFKEIKEEAGVLKKYIQGYKMRMFN
jgi:hypothetical protein